MAREKFFEALQNITEPVVHSLGLKLWGIDVLQSGRPVVRIYVDVDKDEEKQILAPEQGKEQGQDFAQSMDMHSANVEQCAKISRMVGLALEVEDIFSSAYVLEVSSPGLSRPFFKLEQLAAYVGDTIEIVLADFLTDTEGLPPFAKGRKKFSGKLLGITDTSLSLEINQANEQHNIEFLWEDIRKASRVHVFVKPEKPGKKSKNKQ